MFFSCVCVCAHALVRGYVCALCTSLPLAHPSLLPDPMGGPGVWCGRLGVAWLCVRVLGGQRDTAVPAVPLEELGDGGRGREVPQLSHLSSLGLGFKLHNRKGLDQVAQTQGAGKKPWRAGSRCLRVTAGTAWRSGPAQEARHGSALPLSARHWLCRLEAPRRARVCARAPGD